jgi:hypothetical protein
MLAGSDVSQFINPKKRSYLLPDGCKDLIDLWQPPKSKGIPNFKVEDMLRSIIHGIVFMAQEEQATELVIGVPSTSGDMPIRYKVENSWHDLVPFPTDIRKELLAGLADMAHLPDGSFPKRGVLDITLAGVRLHWIVSLASADGLCTLVRVRD